MVATFGSSASWRSRATGAAGVAEPPTVAALGEAGGSGARPLADDEARQSLVPSAHAAAQTAANSAQGTPRTGLGRDTELAPTQAGTQVAAAGAVARADGGRPVDASTLTYAKGQGEVYAFVADMLKVRPAPPAPPAVLDSHDSRAAAARFPVPTHRC